MMTPRTIHGMSKTPEFRAWASMIQRCLNPNSSRYYRYGGRGITICARWQSFEAFFADVGRRPAPEYSIDRIDNDGDYEPANVRWATRSEQQRNKGPYPYWCVPHGDDHWTRRDRDRAVRIGRQNIRKAHKSGAENNNAKLNQQLAETLRSMHAKEPEIDMRELGRRFGVGRETARKIVRGLAWR